jgi:hypothetical protein
MELAGAVWADLFLGALALVRRAFQKTIRFLARLCSRAGEKHDHCDMLNRKRFSAPTLMLVRGMSQASR